MMEDPLGVLAMTIVIVLLGLYAFLWIISER